MKTKSSYSEIERACLKQITKQAIEGGIDVLSELLDLEIEITREEIMNIEELQSYFTGNNPMVFVYLEIIGPVEGDLLLLFDYSKAGFLVDMVLGMDLERPSSSEIDQLLDYDKQTIFEVSKVMNNLVIDNLSQNINLSLGGTIPEIFLGNFRKTPFPASMKNALIILNEFSIVGMDSPLGTYFIMPKKQALKFFFHACRRSLKKLSL